MEVGSRAEKKSWGHGLGKEEDGQGEDQSGETGSEIEARQRSGLRQRKLKVNVWTGADQMRKGRLSAGPGRLDRDGWTGSVLAPPRTPGNPPMASLTEHAFAQAPQAEVGSLESLPPLLVQRQLLALDKDRTAALQHALGGALHHQQVPRVARVLQCVDGQLWAGKGGAVGGHGGWGRSWGRGARPEGSWGERR